MHEPQVLIPELSRQVPQHPFVLHEVEGLGAAVGMPRWGVEYHSRQVRMKSVKSWSASSRAVARVLEEGGVLLS